MNLQINTLFIDAKNNVFETRKELKERGINGEYINNRIANKLISEGEYEKVGGYSFGNEQDIRLLEGKMLIFIDRLKKFVICGIKK